MTVGRYRKVSVQIWGDERFSRLTHEGKLAFLFVLTHPNMTGIGAMRGTIEGLCSELKALPEAFGEAFREGLLEASPEAPLITLPKFVRHNKPESPNVCTSWAQVIQLLPECRLLDRHIYLVHQELKGFGEAFAKAFGEALPKGLPEALPEALPESGTGTGTGTGLRSDSPPPLQKPSHPHGSGKPSPDEQETTTLFPVRTGEDYELPAAKVDQWRKAHPKLDVEAELAKARQWLRDNPGRRKTAAGMTRFLGSWLNRAADKSSKGKPADISCTQEFNDDDPFKPD